MYDPYERKSGMTLKSCVFNNDPQPRERERIKSHSSTCTSGVKNVGWIAVVVCETVFYGHSDNCDHHLGLLCV